jgi:hypothetical protein
MGVMLLPTDSQAESAAAPVRARQMEGGEVSQKVPFVVRVVLGMARRSKTGAVMFVSGMVGRWREKERCTVVGCGSPVILFREHFRAS